MEIITEENLKATKRTTPPKSRKDYNYFINQLVECGRLSAHEAQLLYQDEEDREKKMKPKFKITDITPAIKSAVNAVLVAKAFAQVEREKMDTMDRDILTAANYWSDPEKPRRTIAPKIRITDPKDTWLLAKGETKDYYLERNARIKKMGYDLKPGYCPALIAESILSDTQHLLVEVAKPVFGIDLHDLLCAGMNKYHKYIDLLCKLVVNMPGFKNPLEA